MQHSIDPSRANGNYAHPTPPGWSRNPEISSVQGGLHSFLVFLFQFVSPGHRVICPFPGTVVGWGVRSTSPTPHPIAFQPPHSRPDAQHPGVLFPAHHQLLPSGDPPHETDRRPAFPRCVPAPPRCLSFHTAVLLHPAVSPRASAAGSFGEKTSCFFFAVHGFHFIFITIILDKVLC